MNASPQSDRIPELDGLRGIAIGLVLFFHYFVTISQFPTASAPSRLVALGRFSWSGVDLFFVLSGFLIGGILLDAREASNYYSVFYRRRFFRIVPIYLLCLLGFLILRALVSAGHASSFGYMMGNQLPIAPYFVFLQNFWMAKNNSLGAYGLGATWSLAVEEQFYLTLPVLIRILSRQRLVIFLVTAIPSAILLRVVFLLLWPGDFIARFVIMPCRADSLLFGVLGALLVRDPASRNWLSEHRVHLYVSAGGLALGLALSTYLKLSQFSAAVSTGGYFLLAILYLNLLLLAVTGGADGLKRILRMKALTRLGAIAYGTYLLHAFVLGAFFSAFRSEPPVLSTLKDLGIVLASLVATILLCRMSWVYFEAPLIRLAHGVQYNFASVVQAPPTFASTVSSTHGSS